MNVNELDRIGNCLEYILILTLWILNSCKLDGN